MMKLPKYPFRDCKYSFTLNIPYCITYRVNAFIQCAKLDDWFSDHKERIMEEEDEPDCPTLSLSKEEKRRLREPWKQTLILMLLGRTIGINILSRKIKETWRPKAAVDLVTVIFLAKFASVDDYEYAMFGGP